jgi:hypothetical protein
MKMVLYKLISSHNVVKENISKLKMKPLETAQTEKTPKQ